MIYFFKSSYIRVNVEKNYDNVTVSFFVFVFCSVLLFGLVTLLCLLGGFFCVFVWICLVLGVVGLWGRGWGFLVA